MIIRFKNLLSHLRASFWVIPATMCIFAYALSLLALWLDRTVTLPADTALNFLLYAGDAEGARTLLSSIATSMITVSGVTFSVTVVALSLAASQYGPRLLLNFMKDRGNQIVLGTFISTFLYCLLVLWHGTTPQATLSFPVSASIAVLLALLSVWVLIFFFHHVSQSIRAENIVVLVAEDVIAAIDQYLNTHAQAERKQSPTDCISEPEFNFTIGSATDGYIQAIDPHSLSDLACKNQLCIKLCCSPGDFVTKDQPLFKTTIECNEELKNCISRNIVIGRFRTGEDDPEYGIHQLVEVAVRALSPGINDPNTAISCLDWLRVIMKKFIESTLPSPYVLDRNKELRLVVDTLHFDTVVATSFNEIRQNAYTTPSVAIHLMKVLSCLIPLCDSKDKTHSLFNQAKMLFNGTMKTDLVDNDQQDLTSLFQRLKKQVEQREDY